MDMDMDMVIILFAPVAHKGAGASFSVSFWIIFAYLKLMAIWNDGVRSDFLTET